MKKKLLLFLSVIAVFLFSAFVVKAITPDNPLASVNVTVTGETTHGEINLDYRKLDSFPEDTPNGSSLYKVIAQYRIDPGYYVESLDVTFGGQPIELGFEAAREQGMLFRRTPFTPSNDLYEFFIPEAASESNKVEVSIKFTRKAPIDISFKLFTGGDSDDIHDNNNYGPENVLIEGYRDGDIVLPEDCNANGCKLIFSFDNQEIYNSYKNSVDGLWFHGEAVNLDNNENTFYPGDNDGGETPTCDDTNFVCELIVKKEFNNISYGNLFIGYSNIVIFATNFIGFDVKADIENFDDMLFENGTSTISFSEGHLEKDVTLFYGTKELVLTKKVPRPLDKDGESYCGTLDTFDDVVGDGFGYSTSYNSANGVVNVAIDSYYQDQMILDLTIKKNSSNIFSDNIKITLNRFAFAGNAMHLFKVDSSGVNCQDAGNNCSQGEYYSTEYRGVLNAFYTVPNAQGVNEHFSNFYDVTSIVAGAIVLENGLEYNAYPRNKDFNPYAVALFYDEDEMVVETKTFNLNADVYEEGLMPKEKFLTKYGSIDRNVDDLVKDYVLFRSGGIDKYCMMEDIDYFDGNNLESSFMHNIVLIGTEEAQEKGIKKIALFLVNGEVEEDDIPALTFGTGKGIIFDVPQEGGNG